MFVRKCDREHATKRNGVWRPGSQDVYQGVVQGNGRLQIRVRCGACRQSCGFLPHDVWRLWVSRQQWHRTMTGYAWNAKRSA